MVSLADLRQEAKRLILMIDEVEKHPGLATPALALLHQEKRLMAVLQEREEAVG